ncbi:MAG: hypothetical protein LBJ61_12505 [Deltaproteobacteria bacterium]|nr:hypothetical protein [Deltaproteobacteria bacterium]
MDDWFNLRGDSSGKQKSLRGPLLLLIILVFIVAAFYLIYKHGEARLKALQPTGQSQSAMVAAQNQKYPGLAVS